MRSARDATCVVGADESRMTIDRTKRFSLCNSSAANIGAASAMFSANTRILRSIGTEQRHHIGSCGLDAKQFGCIRCIPNFELSLIKHPVCIDRFPLNRCPKLVQDDAAKTAVDPQHEKLRSSS